MKNSMRISKTLISAVTKHREAVGLAAELSKYWADYVDIAFRVDGDDANYWSDYLAHDHKDLPYAGPAWDFVLRETPVNKVNRCETSMLAGPLFVSDKYPWPRGRKGWPLEPVIQFDLRIATALQRDSGLFEQPVDFGDGLLQVWFDDIDASICRVVPRSEAVAENLQCIPSDLASDFIPLDWIDGAPVCLIDSLQSPHFTMPNDCEFDVAPDLLPWRFRGKRRRLEMLLKWLEKKSGPKSGHHLFGTFYEIQYFANEKPKCFLQLDSCVPFEWGDVGTAQVFYEVQRTGEIKFSFDWSCG